MQRLFPVSVLKPYRLCVLIALVVGLCGLTMSLQAAQPMYGQDNPLKQLQVALNLDQALDRSTPPLPDDLVDLRIFVSVYRRILNEYYLPVEGSALIAAAISHAQQIHPDPTQVSRGKIVRTAIDGMMDQLDEYSVFLNTEENDLFEENISGQYGGVGLYLKRVDEGMQVEQVVANGPALEAGMLAGDVIVRVNDRSIVGMNSAKAVILLRGKPGTTVKINVLRERRHVGFSVRRRLLNINPVTAQLRPDGVLWIKLTTFNDQATEELRKAIGTIMSDGRRSGDASPNEKISGLIFDLRNNRGGSLDQSISISDYFLDPGVVVYTQDRNHKRAYSHARTPDQMQGKPMVVLVDGQTASAAEIVAGALQDHRRAKLVGEPTFGKGVVQLKYSLARGMGVKLTTQEYFTPQGQSVDGGIDPDVFAQDDLETEVDEQFQAALKELSHQHQALSVS